MVQTLIKLDETDASINRFTLRPFQEDSIEFINSRDGRALIYHQPGMGKTPVASEYIVRYGKLPAIVFCPTYAVRQWAKFLADRYPTLRVVAATGTLLNRAAALEAKADFYVCNTEMLRGYIIPDAVQSIVYDESHHLKNRKAEQSKIAAGWSRIKPVVIELTATPIHREADDLFHQLAILDNVKFDNYYKFIDQYCTSWGGFSNTVSGVRYPKKLNALLREYGHGKTYEDVGLELPDLVTNNIEVDMNPTARKIYREARDLYIKNCSTDGVITSFRSAIEMIHHLRRLTLCKEKIDAIKSLIDDNVTTNGVVVFCWYKQTAETLAAALKADLITGDIPAQNRLSIARRSKKIVATISSMSESIDLSHLRTVIYAEEDYTVGAALQSVGRVRRWSQNMMPVVAYYVMCTNTIDYAIHLVAERRIGTAEAVLEMELLHYKGESK